MFGIRRSCVTAGTSILLALAANPTQCNGTAAQPQIHPPPATPTLAAADLLPDARRGEIEAVMARWLYCIECDEKELDKVLVPLDDVEKYAIVRRIEPLFSDLYRPDGGTGNVIADHLRETYRELVAYRRTHPENVLASNSEDEFVKLYLGTTKRWVQQRALILLLSLKTPEAYKTLRNMQSLDLPKEIEQLLGRIVVNLP